MLLYPTVVSQGPEYKPGNVHLGPAKHAAALQYSLRCTKLDSCYNVMWKKQIDLAISTAQV